MSLDGGRLEGEIHIGRHLGAQAAQPLFLMLGAVVAMLGQMPGQRLSLGAEAGVLDPVGGQWVLGHAGPLPIDLQTVRVGSTLTSSRLVPGTQ